MNRRETFVAVLELKPLSMLGVVYPYVWPRITNGTPYDRFVIIEECHDGSVRFYCSTEEENESKPQ